MQPNTVHHGPNVTTVSLSPSEAAMILAKNTGNRALRKSWVSFLRKQMIEGRWTLTSDAISISASGRLLNGQHRLSAIASLPEEMRIKVLISRGMPEEGFLVQDMGVKRTIADNTRLEPEFVADVTMMFNLSRRTERAARVEPSMVLDYQDVWRPIHTILWSDGVTFGRKRGFSSAPLRVAVGLRWASETTKARRDYVLQQYNAFGSASVERMSKSTATLFRRMSETGWRSIMSSGSNMNRMKALIIYWLHFDPDRKNVEPIMRDEAAQEAFLRDYACLLPDAFAAGPARDGHPFHFENRPTFRGTRLTGAAAMRAAK
jgi:hypothetical protein